MNFFKLLLFILLFFTTYLSAQNGSLEKVTLQLQWKHQFEFAGFYAAKEQGFYKAIGLDVDFLEYDGKRTMLVFETDERAVSHLKKYVEYNLKN